MIQRARIVDCYMAPFDQCVTKFVLGNRESASPKSQGQDGNGAGRIVGEDIDRGTPKAITDNPPTYTCSIPEFRRIVSVALTTPSNVRRPGGIVQLLCEGVEVEANGQGLVGSEVARRRRCGRPPGASPLADGSDGIPSPWNDVAWRLKHGPRRCERSVLEQGRVYTLTAEGIDLDATDETPFPDLL